MGEDAHPFTVIAMVYTEDTQERMALVRVTATSPVNAISMAAEQVEEDVGPDSSYLVLAILDGWSRDYLNPTDDKGEETQEWEEELDRYFLSESLDWKPTRTPEPVEPLNLY
jgi:hypothetical protein